MLLNKIELFLNNDRGASAIEYALIGSLVSIAAVAATELIGVSMFERFEYIGSLF